MQGRKEHHGGVLQTLYFQNWTYTTKKLDQPQACMKSKFFTITHQHTSQSWWKSIFPRKALKLCPTLPTPRILHHVFFSVSKLKEKPLRMQNSTPVQPSDLPFSSVWTTFQKRTKACIWTMDTKTKEVCRCSGSLLWKDADKKSV